MKNYEVEAVICFNDKEEKIQRQVGDKFYCTEERYNVMKRKNAVKLLKIQTSTEETVEKELSDEIVEETIVSKFKKKKTSKK